MKCFSAELKKQANRKFAAVFLLTFLFAFGISAYQSYNYAQHLESTMKVRMIEAEKNIESVEANLPSYAEAGEGLRTLWEEGLDRLKALKAAYEDGDTPAIIKNRLRLDEITIEQEKFGARLYNATDRRKVTEEAELYRILLDQGITAYRDPLLEAHDGVASIDYFLKTYMLFLLPAVVMLIGANSLSSERESGSDDSQPTSPRSRFSALTAKFFASVALSLAVVLTSILAAFLGGCLFSGAGDFRYPVKAISGLFGMGEETYVASWAVQSQALLITLCALLFFAALALLISVIFKRGILSLCVGTLGAVGAVVLNRQLVIAQKGGFWRYLPFDLSDGYAAALGKIVVPIKEKFANTSELITAQDTGRVLEIVNPFPGAVAGVVLLACASVCFMAAALIFNRRDAT